MPRVKSFLTIKAFFTRSMFYSLKQLEMRIFISVSAMTAATEKFINDPIHGYVRLDSEQLALIDTPQFQRLRDLKQLGSAYFVFPGACHHRFEHSIGVSHLADSMYARVVENTANLEVSKRDRNVVKVAGLVHDLGHGPFSHVFDNEFIPRAR